MPTDLLVDLQYLPNCYYLSYFLQFQDIIFNDLVHFEKQSHQNRTYISGANKILPLIIPLKKGKTHIPYKEVVIDYQAKWAKIHWHSIVSSYNKSPFFFHYRDQFEKHYLSNPKYLLDFNFGLMNEITDILGISNNMTFISARSDLVSENIKDLTNHVHRKTYFFENHNEYVFKKYQQVFSDRFDFISGLSVIDLIFNVGPEAIQIIESGIQTRLE